MTKINIISFQALGRIMKPIFFIKTLNIFNLVTVYNHHLRTWSSKRN